MTPLLLDGGVVWVRSMIVSGTAATTAPRLYGVVAVSHGLVGFGPDTTDGDRGRRSQQPVYHRRRRHDLHQAWPRGPRRRGRRRRARRSSIHSARVHSRAISSIEWLTSISVPACATISLDARRRLRPERLVADRQRLVDEQDPRLAPTWRWRSAGGRIPDEYVRSGRLIASPMSVNSTISSIFSLTSPSTCRGRGSRGGCCGSRSPRRSASRRPRAAWAPRRRGPPARRRRAARRARPAASTCPSRWGRRRRSRRPRRRRRRRP